MCLDSLHSLHHVLFNDISIIISKPIQIINSGPLEDTLISCNSVRKSHFRGIVIDGTSHLTIFKNVVHECYGNAYSLQGQYIEVLDNIASDVKRVLPSISGQTDHEVRAFHCPYQYNTFIGNKAIGSEFYGFLVTNDDYIPPALLVSVSLFPYRKTIFPSL